MNLFKQHRISITVAKSHWKYTYWTLLVLILMLNGCGNTSRLNDSQFRSSIIAIATESIKQSHPDWLEETNVEAKIIETREYWIVSYKLDENTIGGTPIVEIRKSTNQVERIYHMQ